MEGIRDKFINFEENTDHENCSLWVACFRIPELDPLNNRYKDFHQVDKCKRYCKLGSKAKLSLLQIKKKLKKHNKTYCYMNWQFILIGISEMKPLWYKATFVEHLVRNKYLQSAQ